MIEIRSAATPSDWAQVRALLTDYVEWLRHEVGVDPLAVQPGFAGELEAPERCFGRTDALMMVAAERDAVVGTVALRWHDDGTTELKRLFVSPAARGLGVGDLLVSEAIALTTGPIWLETVRGVMDTAIALYHRHGFHVVADHGRTVNVDGLVLMERCRPRSNPAPSLAAGSRRASPPGPGSTPGPGRRSPSAGG